jgi:nicotinamide-nucleotide amidase
VDHATAAILSVGDELALGQTLDTNSAWLSAHLVEIGIVPVEHAAVHDDRPAIASAIARLATVADLVIVTGGLGPTADDLTRQGLADAMGEPLIADADALAEVKRWFESRGRTMPDINAAQALRPASARVLRNENGTAPGLHGLVRADGRAVDVFCLPGPPREMMLMFATSVTPSLRAPAGRVVLTRSIRTFGLGESDVATRLGELMTRGRNPLIGTTVSAGIVTCRVRWEGDPAAGAAAVAQAGLDIRERLGVYAFGEDEDTLASSALALLRSRGLTLATVESCTGGLVGGAITAIAGSSDAYLGGWVTYANELKVGEVGVPAELASPGGPGAVSREAAEAMALGGLERSGAGACVSVTGIAGPGGGTPEKPVGTVWIGLAVRHGEPAAGAAPRILARRFLFPGPRESVRTLSVNAALAIVRLGVLGEEAPLLREIR